MPMRQHLFGGMLAAATLIVPDVAHAAAELQMLDLVKAGRIDEAKELLRTCL